MHREVLIEWQLKHDCTGFGGNGASLLHNVKAPFTLGAIKQEKRVGGSLAEVLDFVLDTVRGVTKNPGRRTQQFSGRVCVRVGGVCYPSILSSSSWSHHWLVDKAVAIT
jgi:hypothetical protein